MLPHFSRLVVTGGLGLALWCGAQPAFAQVPDSTQTKPELNTLPPDRPVLDGRPPAPPLPTPAQPAPAGAPGGFQPARPTQPTAQPAPARNPALEAGTPVAAPVLLPEPPPAKWFVEGNPDLNFGSFGDYSYFAAGLSALFGYRVNDRIAIGPGFTYLYSSYKSPAIGRANFNNVGLRLFGQFTINDNFFLHGEHEILRTQYVDNTGALYLDRRVTLRSTFAGIGYRSHFGRRAALDIIGLYNFNHATNFFIYSQPELRFNFLFDLF